MSGSAATAGLLAAFPAAGAGSSTLRVLESLAARRGMAFLAMPNAASVDALASGKWQQESSEEIRRAVAEASAERVVLVGHCMGGLSAIELAAGLAPTLDAPVRTLIVNTPCPDSAGLIPTMSRSSNAEIAATLVHSGFPPEVLGHEELLEQIADGVRADALTADRLAVSVNEAGELRSLHVLTTRGDPFTETERCAAWRARVSGEFHLTIADGGHMLDKIPIGTLRLAIDSVVDSAQGM